MPHKPDPYPPISSSDPSSSEALTTATLTAQNLLCEHRLLMNTMLAVHEASPPNSDSKGTKIRSIRDLYAKAQATHEKMMNSCRKGFEEGDDHWGGGKGGKGDPGKWYLGPDWELRKKMRREERVMALRRFHVNMRQRIVGLRYMLGMQPELEEFDERLKISEQESKARKKKEDREKSKHKRKR